MITAMASTVPMTASQPDERTQRGRCLSQPFDPMIGNSPISKAVIANNRPSQVTATPSRSNESGTVIADQTRERRYATALR